MGAAVAVIALAKQRQTVEAFVRAGATAPAMAQSLQVIGIADGRAVRRLREHAVVREAAPGIYYVDLEVWQAVRRTRQRLVLVLALVVFAAALALGVLGSGTR